MFKTVTLLKRRPDLSMQAFVTYYETYHARIGEKYLAGNAVRYIRRFLHEISDVYASADEKPYDVLTEIWFEDRASFERTFAMLHQPEIAAEIAADEENLFDRTASRIFMVEEQESDVGAVPPDR